ncbi:hypothetical protein DPMN_029566 [Dreissena polymorpha]|uniref:Uncharacterized protein n=1 Tax=Dreissena polymorpha TaxID=45954 RepID=A0A9D4LZG6_DREPO|nr:hypothetical protein DPMN_029566 [Dreissena polymorpha]
MFRARSMGISGGRGYRTYDVDIFCFEIVSSRLCYNLLDDRSGALLIFRMVRRLFLALTRLLTSVGTHIVH